MKDVMLLTGAGQIGMAIARRMGYGMKIVIGDKKAEHAETVSRMMNEAGFDTKAVEMDLSLCPGAVPIVLRWTCPPGNRFRA